MEITPAEKELRTQVSRYLKAELKRSGITHEQLIEKLTAMGLHETKASIANMLSRGSFPTTFFVAVMKAIEKRSVNIDDF